MYSSMIPYHLRLGMGKKHVKCNVSVTGVEERDSPLDLGGKLAG